MERAIKEFILLRLALLREKHVYVFGAGDGGRLTVYILKKMGIQPCAILDNDVNKWGDRIEGIEVKNPESITDQEANDCWILVIVNAYNDIKVQLEGMGFYNYELLLEEIEASTSVNIRFVHEYLQNQFRYLHERIAAFEQRLEFGVDSQILRHTLEDTTKYVLTNMRDAKSFWKREEMYNYVVSQTIPSGSYMEFGVYKGESINYFAKLKPDEVIYGFDSFEGLPEDWRPGFPKGVFALAELPQVMDNVVLVKGWFNETIPAFINDHPNTEKCALIHIDCDLYSSTKVVLDELKNYISTGTIIIFDEYFNYPGWRDGEYKAFQEFVNKHNITYEYIAYASSNLQVAVKITGVGEVAVE